MDPQIQSGPTFTAIDFETANYFRTSACSIGMVRVENGEIVGTFESYIKPYPYWFHPINRGIHGIGESNCIDAPSFSDLWPKIGHWITDQILVAHNASFDRSVLNHLLDHHRIPGEPADYLCTLYLSRIHIQGLNSYKLPSVYHHLFQENMKHHDALADSHACAKIALHINQAWEPPSFEGLVRSIYDSPFKDRDSRSAKTVFSKLIPDSGYESNKLFKGKNFVFTGSIPGMSRYEAAQFVVNHGGKVSDGITKNTTHLVIANYDPNDQSSYLQSGKVKKALENIKDGQQISFISDEDFELMTRIALPEEPADT